MQATAVALFRAIHPPLPLDANAARKLLAVLSESFQHHLDRHHPTGTTLRGRDIKNASGTAFDNPQVPSSFIETKKHFASIINHPTFVGDRRSSSPPSSSLDGFSLSVFHIFEDRLAHGTLTLKFVSKCISTLGSVPMSAKKRRESAFVSRITALLRTTDQVSLSNVLQNRSTCSSWMNQMFQECREMDVWNLIRNGLPGGLFPVFVGAGLHQRDAKFAVATLIKAIEDQTMLQLVKPYLPNALVKLSLNLLSDRNLAGTITSEDYDRILERLDKLDVGIFGAPSEMTFFIAVLHLSHSSLPTTGPAVRFINSITAKEPRSLHLSEIWTTAPSRVNPMLWFCIRASSQLIDNGRNAEAAYILRFAERTYREYLGFQKHQKTQSVKPKKVKERRKSEDSILNKLDGLIPTQIDKVVRETS